MKEHRCSKCNKLLFKYASDVEIVNGKIEIETQHNCKVENNAKVKDIKIIEKQYPTTLTIKKGFNGFKNPTKEIDRIVRELEIKHKMKCKKILHYRCLSDNSKIELTSNKFIETYSIDSTYLLTFELEKQYFVDHEWTQHILNTITK